MRSRGLAVPRALALAALVPLAGCHDLFDVEFVAPVPEGEGDPNAYACACRCFEGTNVELGRRFDTCIPTALREPPIDPADLVMDCSLRVGTMMLSIQKICGSNAIEREIQRGGTCVCQPVGAPTFAESCVDECQVIELASDCSNQEIATSAQNLPPVCIAESDDASGNAAAMGRALFGGRTTCEVAGDLTIAREGEGSQTRPASGVLEVAGGPCPGAGCDVHMAFHLDEVEPFEFSSFAGFASVTIEGIRAHTSTLAPATLDAAGNDSFAPLALASSGRGTRIDEEVFGVISETLHESFVGSNGEPVSIGVDWVGGECELVGSLLGAGLEDAATDVHLHVGGPIVNRPPRADGGPDRSVECTSPAGALVVLDASASSDPDGDLRFREWRVGHAGGMEILDPDGDGVVSLVQGLGTSATYALNVVDSFFSIAQDTVRVQVVDTTAPDIVHVAASPSTLHPPNHAMVPVTLEVMAQDRCGTASCAIAEVTSSDPVNGLGDGDTSPDWIVTGPLTVDLRAEIVGRRRNRVYTINVTCTDDAGNAAGSSAAVNVVVRP